MAECMLDDKAVSKEEQRAERRIKKQTTKMRVHGRGMKRFAKPKRYES